MNAAQPTYEQGLHPSDRPSETESSKYPVHDYTDPKYPVHDFAGPRGDGVISYDDPAVPYRSHQPHRWLRWPYLVLYGLLIAIISGVIGGLAAKSIVQNNDSATPATSTTANPTTPSNATNPTPSASPSPNEHDMYCSREYPQPLKTLFNHDYYFNCSRDWYGDEIAPLFAANTSVCIETCMAYNLKFSTNACIGASFHARLLDLEAAMRFHDAPVNCWLKTGVSGMQAQKGSNDPILSICMNQDCSPAG